MGIIIGHAPGQESGQSTKDIILTVGRGWVVDFYSSDLLMWWHLNKQQVRNLSTPVATVKREWIAWSSVLEGIDFAQAPNHSNVTQ